ncbi:MAG: Lrp/AsnC family transcriptional regulator [Anaerolineae bacterium]|nr:Lrp/AsnC family transcriptional regulator [Anaerolineae bacterium]
MTIEPTYSLDDTDWKLLQALEEDARQSFTALGERIGLSRPAVAERIRRLEELGIIAGYHAEIDLSKLGQGITAFIRMNTNKKEDAANLTALLMEMDEVKECYRGTGGDCFTIKVAVSSIPHLDAVLEQIRDYGNPTTSVMLASVIRNRQLRKTTT